MNLHALLTACNVQCGGDTSTLDLVGTLLRSILPGVARRQAHTSLQTHHELGTQFTMDCISAIPSPRHLLPAEDVREQQLLGQGQRGRHHGGDNGWG